jgi:hypothetical protein
MTKPGTPRRDPATYEVGYGKPPKGGQIKPGEVRNPAGRRGKEGAAAKNKDASTAEAYQEERDQLVEFHDGRKKRKVPKGQLAMTKLLNDAISGKPSAQREVSRREEVLTRERRERDAERLRWGMSYKTSWAAELRRREEGGIAGPEPFPHPDDVIIGHDLSVTIIRPPMGERLTNEMLRRLRDDYLEEIEWLQAALAEEPTSAYLRRDLERAERMLELCNICIAASGLDPLFGALPE